MKRWDQLKAGDYIYYYDHQKIHKQLVKKVDTIAFTKNEKSFDSNFNIVTSKVVKEYLLIYAGKNTLIKLPKNWIKTQCEKYNDYSIRYECMPRFCDEEDARAYMEKLISIRKKRVEKYEKKYLKEKKILDSYCLEI